MMSPRFIDFNRIEESLTPEELARFSDFSEEKLPPEYRFIKENLKLDSESKGIHTKTILSRFRQVNVASSDPEPEPSVEALSEAIRITFGVRPKVMRLDGTLARGYPGIAFQHTKAIEEAIQIAGDYQPE